MSAEGVQPGAESGAGEPGRRGGERAGADAPVTRDAEVQASRDGAARVTRDGEESGRRDAETPKTLDAEAPRAPVTRDVYAPAREHEAPSVGGGRAGVGPASAVSDARGGASGRAEGSTGAGRDLRNVTNAGGELADARAVEAGARETEAVADTSAAGGAATVADASAATESAPAADAAATESAADAERRGRVARARKATRERVGRVRDEALVALEETPDDAGLRFVVAAVALFLVFAFLLVLSLTILR
jgi:hypothetical protein